MHHRATYLRPQTFDSNVHPSRCASTVRARPKLGSVECAQLFIRSFHDTRYLSILITEKEKEKELGELLTDQFCLVPPDLPRESGSESRDWQTD